VEGYFILKKISDILFSYWTMAILLVILGVGAGVATFIENDYGAETSKALVYSHVWYETAMVLTMINMMGVMVRVKMWRNATKFILHFAFVVILLGAAMTRYMGFEGIMHIREGKTENKMISSAAYLQIKIQNQGKSYYQEYPLRLGAIGDNSFEYDIEFNGKILNINFTKYAFQKEGRSTMGILSMDATIGNDTKSFSIMGDKGRRGVEKTQKVGDSFVSLQYGSKILELPFSIKLNDFQLDRYPGSMSPSSYASEVTVYNEDEEFDYRIFMNTTLHNGNYLFFQSSYDQDEQGTILSVNNDPGKWPTYFGYFLLTLGLTLNLFDKKGRFFKLTSYLKKQNLASFLLAAMMFGSINTYAAENDSNSNYNNGLKDLSNDVVTYLNSYKESSKETAKDFGRLVAQNSMGRMKPLNSLNGEILSKLSGKGSFYGMNADQVILGMLTRPEMWRNVKMIKIKTPKLKKTLGISDSRRYIAFSEIFKDGKYILQEFAQAASRTNPNERGTFEKDILTVDERLNIAYMVFNGNLFNIMPQRGTKDNKWVTPLDAIKTFQGKDQKAVESMIRGFVGAVVSGNWVDAKKFISFISLYQEKVGAEVIPSKSQIENEILFNQLDVFPKLTIAYELVGFILFLIAFSTVFNQKLKSPMINRFFLTVLGILFLAHTFGMGFRWVISGHAPWSDTYESLLYISWSAMFAGLLFFRKSLLALSAAVIVAGIFMFTAHLSHINPQITDLVPVLKSYWLTIHVSILTGSYGFLGLGAVLGIMSLIFFIFRGKKRKHLDDVIKQITAINEASLIVGLAMLTIGNFLGGVWANESWGRYWGWDPKETWAYVAIVTYILILHLRFIKRFNNPFSFSVSSVLAFSTILMTYFGVNFYLSGMHSYASGDPVPVPTWVYFAAASVFVLIGLAYKNRNLKDDFGEDFTETK